MKKITLFLISTFATIIAFGQAKKVEPEPLLHGKVFTVKLKQLAPEGSKKAKDKEMDDEFSFKGGKFKSKYFNEEFKVPTKPYDIGDVDTISDNNVVINWTADIEVSESDRLFFTGKVEGASLTGLAEWTVKNKPKKTIQYEYIGEIKEKKKK